jgi:hypothetical protein
MGSTLCEQRNGLASERDPRACEIWYARVVKPPHQLRQTRRIDTSIDEGANDRASRGSRNPPKGVTLLHQAHHRTEEPKPLDTAAL